MWHWTDVELLVPELKHSEKHVSSKEYIAANIEGMRRKLFRVAAYTSFMDCEKQNLFLVSETGGFLLTSHWNKTQSSCFNGCFRIAETVTETSYSN